MPSRRISRLAGGGRARGAGTRIADRGGKRGEIEETGAIAGRPGVEVAAAAAVESEVVAEVETRNGMATGIGIETGIETAIRIGVVAAVGKSVPRGKR